VNDTIFASTSLTNTTNNLANSLWQPTAPLFRPSDPTLALPAPTLPSPYYQNELLNKIYNNITTHSDTFAVFLTIGFFEVVDETTRPVKLGAEINAAQGANIRHRMVAIVDRTNLEVFGQATPVATNTTFDTNIVGSYPYEFPLAAYDAMNNLIGSNLTMLSGTNQYTGRTWTIQPGMVLTFDPNNANEESVAVYSKPIPLAGGGTGTGYFGLFRRPHPYVGPGSVQVISRGNPGPWTVAGYSPRRDATVVPFFAIIN
jgi:hypothetical protein